MANEPSVEKDLKDTEEIFRLPPSVESPDADTVPGFQYDGVLGDLERLEIQSHQSEETLETMYDDDPLSRVHSCEVWHHQHLDLPIEDTTVGKVWPEMYDDLSTVMMYQSGANVLHHVMIQQGKQERRNFFELEFLYWHTLSDLVQALRTSEQWCFPFEPTEKLVLNIINHSPMVFAVVRETDDTNTTWKKIRKEGWPPHLIYVALLSKFRKEEHATPYVHSQVLKQESSQGIPGVRVHGYVRQKEHRVAIKYEVGLHYNAEGQASDLDVTKDSPSGKTSMVTKGKPLVFPPGRGHRWIRKF